MTSEPAVQTKGFVRTVGGDAANHAWSRIRARVPGVPLTEARRIEAAYGTALLALG